MVYICYYHCPHCKHPNCGEDPMRRANELIPATSKADARATFNHLKPCRHIKLISIEETTLCTG